MFDIGFSELMLVGLVTLLVFGPERLPGAVRTTGLWVGKAKRGFNALKAEVEKEIGADEIRRELHNAEVLAMEQELKAKMQALHSDAQQLGQSINESVTAAQQELTPKTDPAALESSAAEAEPAEQPSIKS